jgi:hypothetical protein
VSEAARDADAYYGVQEGRDGVGEVNDIFLGRDGAVEAVLVDIGGPVPSAARTSQVIAWVGAVYGRP